MIRVLHYLGSDGMGGISKLVYDLISFQKKNPEIDVNLVLGHSQGTFLEDFKSLGINVYILDFNSGFDLSLSKISKFRKLANLVDIIHFHTYDYRLCPPLIRFNAKSILTEHGLFGLGRKRKLRDYIKNLFKTNFLNKYCDYIIFNSFWTKTKAFKVFKLNRNVNSDVVYNGNNIKKGLKVQYLSKNNNNFCVGFVGRLAGVKRIDRLIDAFSTIELNNEKFKLQIVGEGPLRKELENQAKKISKAKVEFIGATKEVEDYYSRFDVVVFPSEGESFGLVAIEALSFGIPVIVMADGGGFAEILFDLEPHDIIASVYEMAQRIIYYYDHPEEIKLKKDKRIEYAAKFSPEKMEKEYYQIYLKLV